MIKIGSRKSPLAIRQAEEALSALKAVFPDETFEIIGISTEGDKNLNAPLKSFGGKGVFIKELEAALLSGEIDIAVHSAKDMPAELPDGLCLSAALTRGPYGDVLVSLTDSEPKVIGTGSARREVQLRGLYPNAQIKPIRGNIHTRIGKLQSGEYDAIALAEAAIKRLDIHDGLKITPLPIVSAAGQGIIALETRSGDTKYAAAVNDADTFTALTAEREFLRLSGGGCHSPVGAYAVVRDGVITMETLRETYGKIIRNKMSGQAPVLLARKMINGGSENA